MRRRDFYAEYQPNAFRAAMHFATDPHGLLGFRGITGTGKTHLEVIIHSCLERRGHRPVYASAPDIADFLRRGQTYEDWEERLRLLQQADVVLIDDLSIVAASAWTQRQFTRIIAYRLAARYPTVLAWSAATQETVETEELAWLTPPWRERLEHVARIVTMCTENVREEGWLWYAARHATDEPGTTNCLCLFHRPRYGEKIQHT